PLGPRSAARPDTGLAVAPLMAVRSRPYGPGRSGPAPLLGRIPASRSLRSWLSALGPMGRAARAPLRCSAGYRPRGRSAHGCPLSALWAGPLGPRFAARPDTGLAVAPLMAVRS